MDWSPCHWGIVKCYSRKLIISLISLLSSCLPKFIFDNTKLEIISHETKTELMCLRLGTSLTIFLNTAPGTKRHWPFADTKIVQHIIESLSKLFKIVKLQIEFTCVISGLRLPNHYSSMWNNSLECLQTCGRQYCKAINICPKDLANTVITKLNSSQVNIFQRWNIQN